MNTTIRPGTILFALLILGFFGAVPTILTIKNLWTETNIATVTSIILFILFIAGLVVCIWLTLLIKIDSTNQTIKFIYPLRFKVHRFDFKDIEGFRYKYLNARIDYKAIQFKSKSGHKFTVSDFETSNLRELETYCLKTFELKVTGKFLPLDDDGKKREIQSSKYFDIDRAKQIRDMIIIGIIGIVIIIASTIIKNNGPVTIGKLLFYVLMTLVLISMIKKLIKTIETIKKGS